MNAPEPTQNVAQYIAILDDYRNAIERAFTGIATGGLDTLTPAATLARLDAHDELIRERAAWLERATTLAPLIREGMENGTHAQMLEHNRAISEYYLYFREIQGIGN